MLGEPRKARTALALGTAWLLAACATTHITSQAASGAGDQKPIEVLTARALVYTLMVLTA